MSLPKTTLGLAACLPIAGAIAWAIGAANGLGAILGYVFGAFLAVVSVAWQAHWLRVQPARAIRAQMEGFAVKIGALAVFTLIFRFVEPLAQHVSWKAFLLAFAGAVALALPLATWDLSKRIAAGTGTTSDLGSRRTA